MRGSYGNGSPGILFAYRGPHRVRGVAFDQGCTTLNVRFARSSEQVFRWAAIDAKGYKATNENPSALAVEFERKAGLAQLGIIQTRCRRLNLIDRPGTIRARNTMDARLHLSKIIECCLTSLVCRPSATAAFTRHNDEQCDQDQRAHANSLLFVHAISHRRLRTSR
jgi:hypothetical protein